MTRLRVLAEAHYCEMEFKFGGKKKAERRTGNRSMMMNHKTVESAEHTTVLHANCSYYGNEQR